MNMSGDHPPPRITSGTPLTRNLRYPCGACVLPATTGVRSEVTVRMPKSSAYRSEICPPTRTSAARWYSGCPPSWYGHQTAGWDRCSCRWSAGDRVTVRVAPAGTSAVAETSIFVPPCVSVSRTSARWVFVVSLRRSARTVRSELLRSLALFWLTCTFRSETGPAWASCGAKRRPVVWSGACGFQSSWLSLRQVFGSFLATSSAIAFAPSCTYEVMSYSNLEYAPWSCARSATFVPLTHRSAVPSTPFMIRYVRPPALGCTVSWSRYHQFALNWSAGTLFSRSE